MNTSMSDLDWMAEEVIELLCTSHIVFYEAVRIVAMTHDLLVKEKYALIEATHQKMIEKISQNL